MAAPSSAGGIGRFTCCIAVLLKEGVLGFHGSVKLPCFLGTVTCKRNFKKFVLLLLELMRRYTTSYQYPRNGKDLTSLPRHYRVLRKHLVKCAFEDCDVARAASRSPCVVLLASSCPSVSNLVTIPQLHYHPNHYTRAAPVAPPAASVKKKDDDRCAGVSVLRVTFGVYIPES